MSGGGGWGGGEGSEGRRWIEESRKTRSRTRTPHADPRYPPLGIHPLSSITRPHADHSAPAASKRRRNLSDGEAPRLGEAHAHFIRDVELAIDSWLESAGHSARLTLPCPSQLSTFTVPVLPSDPDALALLENRLLVSYREVQHFEFLAQGRVADLYARHRQLPDSLNPDQRALISSVLCIGRLGELAFELSPDGEKSMRPIPDGESREDITYFRLALSQLEEFGSASCTALCECGHCLIELG